MVDPKDIEIGELYRFDLDKFQLVEGFKHKPIVLQENNDAFRSLSDGEVIVPYKIDLEQFNDYVIYFISSKTKYKCYLYSVSINGIAILKSLTKVETTKI